MSDFGTILEGKCMNFSIRVVSLCRFLSEARHEYRIADQMFRSGTTIGANVAEAQCAISRNDFVAKLYISLKEANETLYWLNLLHKTQYINSKQYESMHSDCEELKRLLVSVTKKITTSVATAKPSGISKDK